MIRYLIKRVIIGGVSLFFLTLITFILVHAIPGNPFDTGNVSEQILSVLEEKYGMDQPLGIQYIKYMEALVKGDLGMSMNSRKPNRYLAAGDKAQRCADDTQRYTKRRDRSAELCICIASDDFFWCVSAVVSGCRSYRRCKLCASGDLACNLAG